MKHVPFTFRVAVAIWIALGALHVAGARDCVSVLSGTPVPGVAFEIAALLGLLYVLAWLASVVVAPILAIAAALVTLTERRAS